MCSSDLGNPVNGYPTLNAIGIGQHNKQALLYHKTFSPLDPNFKSEREEVKTAIFTISTALRAQGVGRIIWILDRGFDDAKVITWILETGGCYVIRAQHDRNIKQVWDGKTQKLFEVIKTKPNLGTLEMNRPIMVDGKLKRKPTQANTRAGSVWFQNPEVLVNVVNLEFQRVRSKIRDTDSEDKGWMLLTNLPVKTALDAQHVVALYIRRWTIEEVFTWTKTALDWEAARVLNFTAFRTLVALAWTAAAFVFELEATLDPRAIRALALLGGWVPHKSRMPGKRVLVWGLSRFLSGLLLAQTGYAARMHALLLE